MEKGMGRRYSRETNSRSSFNFAGATVTFHPRSSRVATLAIQMGGRGDKVSSASAAKVD